MCVIVALAVVVGLAMFMPTKKADCDYLRLQIFANSNSALDQGVKYEIKDKLIEFLTPYLKTAKNKDNAIKIVKEINFEIANLCKSTLKANNLNYSVNVKLENIYFEKTDNFEAGNYDAVVVELGSASGKTENCLIYPPLNINTKDVKFKSKIFNWLKTIFN